MHSNGNTYEDWEQDCFGHRSELEAEESEYYRLLTEFAKESNLGGPE